jgi:PAS domain S-box-containing protein
MGRAVDEKGLHLETQHHRKDGSVIDVDISINGAMCAGQKLIFCVSRDITERKQAEEALRESQKFSSSLLESSPNPITVVNLDTSTRYVNPAFEKLTGFTLAEIAGMKAPYPWWPEGKRERVLTALKDSIEHGGRRTGTERNFQNKNGERFWVTLISAPVMQDGKPIYLIVSWLDITERKRAEAKEKQLQQELYLAQRLAAVGELAAGVAHEINNPLTGVLGFSQRLMRKSTDKEVSRDLEIIHDEARRAADVVQNLLTFARRRQPKKEYTNINDIVKRTLELRSYALQTSNIEVVTALAHNLPQLMVDFPQIQEVFLNIILNAEQAMSEAHGRGKLVIKTRRVKDHVGISFADDGPGISPENLDKVFDPFFTTREQKGGTGLGLSACHGIVTEHGGRIYLRSKPGQGATFIVELPLSPVETTVVRQS